MALRAMVGGSLGLLGVVCAVVGIFILEGISIEFPGIILGALGYYVGLTIQDRRSQILGIIAVVLNVISMAISERHFGAAAVAHGGRAHPKGALPGLTGIGLECHPRGPSYGWVRREC